MREYHRFISLILVIPAIIHDRDYYSIEVSLILNFKRIYTNLFLQYCNTLFLRKIIIKLKVTRIAYFFPSGSNIFRESVA